VCNSCRSCIWGLSICLPATTIFCSC
jgi:hypothetical protein